MGGEPASGLSNIFEVGLSSDGNDEVVDRSHHMASMSNRHASRIFFECEISSIMQTGFDAPVCASNLQEAGRRSSCARQAGNSKFYFIRSAITASRAPPLELTFEAIDLSQSWPGRIRVEHFTGRKDTRFQTSVPLADFLCGEEIRLDFSKSGSGVFRSKKLLNALI